MRPPFHPAGLRVAAPVVYAPPAPPAAPETREEVLEQHVEAPAPSTRQRALPRLEVLRVLPVETTTAGALTVEVIRRGHRRRCAVVWSHRHRTSVEVSAHALPALIAAIHAAGVELGEFAGPSPTEATQRDEIYDRVARGEELVGGKWVPGTRRDRR